jgi:hypothetical protein
MSITTSTAGNTFFTRIYNIKAVEDCRDLYNAWADTYDADLPGPQQDYVAPSSSQKPSRMLMPT